MLLVVSLLVAGVLLARVPSLPERAPEVLDVVIIWLALPALILREIPRVELDERALIPVTAAWGSLLLCAGLVWLASRAFGWSRRVTGTLMVVVPLGNTSFLGLAAVTALLGEAYLGPALVYDQIGSFLGLATWATVVAARYGDGERPGVAATVGRVLRFPPFVALVLALVLRTIALPAGVAAPLSVVLDGAAALLVPLAMLTVGLRLRWPSTRSGLAPIAWGLGVRMVVAPAAVLATLWGLGLLWGPNTVAGRASVLASAMPPMVTASVLATAAGLDEEVAAGLVGIGVIVALATAPAWAWVCSSL